MDKVIHAVFNGTHYAKTRALTRQDYGIPLVFDNVDVPETFQVHFSHVRHNNGTAKTWMGTKENGVLIPDEYLISGKTVYAWIFVQDSESGFSKYMVEIPVASKPTVTDDPPTPVQRNAWDEAIGELNQAVEDAQEAVEHYPIIQNGYWYVWDVEAQEYVNSGVDAKGEDGDKGDTGVTYTPTVDADGVISWVNDGDLPNPQPRSIKGPTGDDGEKGDKGDKGDRGEKGEKGDAFTYADFTPAQLEALKGPKGDTGPKGDKGDKGDTGAKGDKGDKGDDGKSAYEAAQDGGYSGTESQFNSDLAEFRSQAQAIEAINAKIPAAASSVNKLMDAAAVNAAIASSIEGITGFSYEVVQTLPATGEAGVIYLLPHTGGQTPNVYDEYFWIGTRFELIGSTQIDLTGYATQSWVQQQGYLTEHQSLSAYRTAADQNTIDAGKQPKITASGILKGDGVGGVSAATAGADYLAPSALTPYRTSAAQDAIDVGLLPIVNNAGAHNGIYRGKYLGSSVTAEQYAAINNGTFDDLYIGDYWTIGGVNWRIAAFDYWLHCGDTECTTHHVVIVPDTCLYNAQMNTSNVTTGAYVGSQMYTTNLVQAKTTVNNAFGAVHILNHREYLKNAMYGNVESAGAWYDSAIDLMTEQMVYGGKIFANCMQGEGWAAQHDIDKSQLQLFALEPSRICIRTFWWLRNVSFQEAFASVGLQGRANASLSSNSNGVRPAFGICA